MGNLAKTKPVPTMRIYTCKVDQAAEDDADREATRQAMADNTMSNAALAKWLGVAETTVHKHRNERCVCFRG